MLDIIRTTTEDELRVKGRASRDRAGTEFDPNKWIKEIV